MHNEAISLRLFHDEVQESPQFLQRVLQRCPGDQDAVVRAELHEGTVEERVVILEPCGPHPRPTRPSWLPPGTPCPSAGSRTW